MTRQGGGLILVAVMHACLSMGCDAYRCTDKDYWDKYQKGWEHVENACIYSPQRDPQAFQSLLNETVRDADRLSAEFDAQHLTLPEDDPLSKRAARALEQVKPQLARRPKCSKDQPFDVDSMTTHVIAHDVPAAFSFPNGRIYLTTGLIDPDFAWAARSDDELLGVVAHETIHLVDWHVVGHWAVVRQREAEQAWNALLLLTWLTPIRTHIKSPIEAETYPQRVEFLADSGAVEVLIGLHRNPEAYRAFLSRMATYPYDAEIRETDRKELLEARSDCLAYCLSPTDADVRGSAAAPRLLSAQEEYVLCAETYLALPEMDWKAVKAWLSQPDGVALNDVPARLSPGGRRSMQETVSCTAEETEASMRIARALLGDRAQVANGCPSGRGVTYRTVRR